MTTPRVFLILCAAVLAGASAARAELRSPPPFLPDERFGWAGGVYPRSASAYTQPDEAADVRGFALFMRCLRDTSGTPEQRHEWTEVSFDFGPWQSRRRMPSGRQRVRVGLWSRVEAGAGGNYALQHEVLEYKNLPAYLSFWDTRDLRGERAADLIRRIHRAESVSWTRVADGAASRPHPVTAEGRAHIRRMMEACSISHAPAP